MDLSYAKFLILSFKVSRYIQITQRLSGLYFYRHFCGAHHLSENFSTPRIAFEMTYDVVWLRLNLDLRPQVGWLKPGLDPQERQVISDWSYRPPPHQTFTTPNILNRFVQFILLESWYTHHKQSNSTPQVPWLYESLLKCCIRRWIIVMNRNRYKLFKLTNTFLF